MNTDLPQKILHVDDDFALRELVRAVFDGLDGFELMSAKDGNEAFKKIENFHPDLILLDLSMPEMDGPEFLKKIKAIDGTNHVRVIFITQFDNIVMKGTFESLGVIGVLHKPIDPQTLLNDIRDLWVARKVA